MLYQFSINVNWQKSTKKTIQQNYNWFVYYISRIIWHIWFLSLFFLYRSFYSHYITKCFLSFDSINDFFVQYSFLWSLNDQSVVRVCLQFHYYKNKNIHYKKKGIMMIWSLSSSSSLSYLLNRINWNTVRPSSLTIFNCTHMVFMFVYLNHNTDKKMLNLFVYFFCFPSVFYIFVCLH